MAGPPQLRAGRSRSQRGPPGELLPGPGIAAGSVPASRREGTDRTGDVSGVLARTGERSSRRPHGPGSGAGVSWWRLLLGLAAGILLLYLVLLAMLWWCARRKPGGISARDAMRPLPDLLRLVRRLAADRTLPWRIRVRLVLLLAYLASPIDLVPDVVPVLGYADDAVVTALAAGQKGHRRHGAAPSGGRTGRGAAPDRRRAEGS